MTGFKIDLKSLKDKHDKKGDNSSKKEESLSKTKNIEKTKEVKEKNPNLNSVKGNEDVQKDTPDIKDDEVKKDSEVASEKTKSAVKSTKINLGGIKSLDNTDEKINSNAKIKEDIKIKEEKPEKEVFKEYKSEFEKNKTSILEKLKKLKLVPKTRFGFLIFLIVITASSIGALFIFFPEQHSIQIYKSKIYSILNIQENIDIPTKTIVSPTPAIEKEKIVEQGNKIIKDGLEIKYQKEIIDGKEVIIYNNKKYNSKEEFEKSLDKVIDKIKKDKLSDFLKNNFK